MAAATNRSEYCKAIQRLTATADLTMPSMAVLWSVVLPLSVALSAFTATGATTGAGGDSIDATLVEEKLADNDPAGAALLVQQNVGPAVASG